MAKQFEYEQKIEYLKMSVEDIKQTLDNKPVLYAFIIHDKDKDTDPHIHVMVKLLNSDMTADSLCKWFKDEPQYINIKQSKWGSKLSYLCHRTPKDRDKFQYEPTEVIANFDYPKELEEIGKAVAQHLNLAEILEKIDNGSIREFNLTEYVDIETFTKYKVKLLNGLEYYRRKVMTNKDRNIQVMIFTGETGTFKTTYAKNYCKNAKKSFCISSASNDPLQDYKGEDVLILDDLRDDTFKFADFLKLLDNHTNSTISSRYNNKAFIGDTIIITSAVNIVEWYKFEKQENRDQMFRRIPVHMRFDKKNIHCYQFNEEKKIYELLYSVPNIAKYDAEEKKELVINALENMGVTMTEDFKNKLRQIEIDKSIDDLEF